MPGTTRSTLRSGLPYRVCLSAARYESDSPGAPKHLAMYELGEHRRDDVGRVPELTRPTPTEWTKRCITGCNRHNLHPQHIRADIPDRGRRRHAAQSGMAPALQIGRMTVPPELDAEWNDWYNGVYVPNYMKVPGCIRGRRYRAVVGEPAYSTVYELEHPDVSKTDEWLRQRAIDPRNERWQNTMEHAVGSPGVWVKTFEIG